jgi:hypothetical protein
MIARPRISRNAWKAAERGAFGNVATLSWPRSRRRCGRGSSSARPRTRPSSTRAASTRSTTRSSSTRASALCYSRLARYDHPLERAVVKTYSVDCEGCDEAGDGRLEFPLTGYVVDQVGDAYCMVSFALELAGFRAGQG